MTKEQAFSLVKKALEATKPGASNAVSMETHLVDEDVIDSLDSMNFLFELEKEMGTKIAAIDETFEDFRVSTLVELVAAAKS